MDCYQIFEPLSTQIEGVHYDQTPYLGSQHSNQNAVYGYIRETKPRWTNTSRQFNDLAALERHGIDPTRPVPAGVVVMADPYGYPVDGFTTGYTTKLPPPSDLQVAQNTPKSFNVPSVVQRGDGGGSTSGVPGDQPTDNPAEYKYGEAAQQATQLAAQNAGKRAALITELVRASHGTLTKEHIGRLM
jgi:hypothetical protein